MLEPFVYFDIFLDAQLQQGTSQQLMGKQYSCFVPPTVCCPKSVPRKRPTCHAKLFSCLQDAHATSVLPWKFVPSMLHFNQLIRASRVLLANPRSAIVCGSCCLLEKLYERSSKGSCLLQSMSFFLLPFGVSAAFGTGHYPGLGSASLSCFGVPLASFWRAWFVVRQELFHPRFETGLFSFPSLVACTTQLFPPFNHPLKFRFLFCMRHLAYGSSCFVTWKWFWSLGLHHSLQAWLFLGLGSSHPGSGQLVQARSLGIFGIQPHVSIGDRHRGGSLPTFGCVAAFGTSRISARRSTMVLDFGCIGSRRVFVKAHLVFVTSRLRFNLSLAFESSCFLVSSILSRPKGAHSTVMSASCTCPVHLPN